VEALDPRAARLLQMLAAGETAATGPETPEQRRASLKALADLAADPVPPEVRCEDLACPAGDGTALAIRRYMPPDASRGALLYLHGGGWVAGDLDTHAGVCGALALHGGCSVFALHYRRPPEHPFPGPIEDALDALAWLEVEAEALGIDHRRIGLAGDSAGGALAAAAAQGREVALLLLVCPILDLPRATGSRETYGRGYFLSAERLVLDAADYLGGAPADHPRASPALGPPPRAGRVLVHAAGCDPFRDEALDYAERLRQGGAEVEARTHPGMIHYFYALPRMIPYARTALAGIGAELRQALG
jgi:acetyl esterase